MGTKGSNEIDLPSKIKINKNGLKNMSGTKESLEMAYAY